MKQAIKLLNIGIILAFNIAATPKPTPGKLSVFALRTAQIAGTLLTAEYLKFVGTEQKTPLNNYIPVGHKPEPKSRWKEFKGMVKEDVKDTKDGLLMITTLGSYKPAQ